MFFIVVFLTIASLVGLSSPRPGVLDEIRMLEASNSSHLRYPTDASFSSLLMSAAHSLFYSSPKT